MEIPEILLMHKPGGITSFGVIRELRKRLGVRKMGHAGTLDPMAEGLLVIGVGKGTKRLAEFIKLDKTYEAEIKLGERTDTGDIEGRVLESADVAVPPSEKEVGEILGGLVGEIELAVPAYSAIKQGGVPLYKKARKGEEVEVPMRAMRIYAIGLQNMRHEGGRAYLSVRMDVGSGTYVRSIAEELGRRLGIPATLSGLRRTRIGDFHLKDAKRIEEFDEKGLH